MDATQAWFESREGPVLLVRLALDEHDGRRLGGAVPADAEGDRAGQLLQPPLVQVEPLVVEVDL